MKTSTVKLIVAVLALSVGVVFSAFAAPMSAQVPLSQGLQSFFASHGIDTKYIGQPQNMVPADTWNKILSLQNDPALLGLVQDDLNASIVDYGSDVSLRIGDRNYELSMVGNSAHVPAQLTITSAS